MSEDRDELGQVAQSQGDKVTSQEARKMDEFLKGQMVAGAECPGCGGGPVIVAEAAVDPTDQMPDGAPVYVVKQHCDECGLDWEDLVTFEPNPDRRQ